MGNGKLGGLRLASPLPTGLRDERGYWVFDLEGLLAIAPLRSPKQKVPHSRRPACVLCVSPAADHGRDPTLTVIPGYSSTQGAQLGLFGK